MTTSGRGAIEWPGVFGDPLLAAAAMTSTSSRATAHHAATRESMRAPHRDAHSLPQLGRVTVARLG